MREYSVTRHGLRQKAIGWIAEEKMFLRQQSSAEARREEEARKLRVYYATTLIYVERLR